MVHLKFLNVKYSPSNDDPSRKLNKKSDVHLDHLLYEEVLIQHRIHTNRGLLKYDG